MNSWKGKIRIWFNLPTLHEISRREAWKKHDFLHSNGARFYLVSSHSCSLTKKMVFSHNRKAISWLVVHRGIQWMCEVEFMSCCVVPLPPPPRPPQCQKETGGSLSCWAPLDMWVAVSVNGCMFWDHRYCKCIHWTLRGSEQNVKDCAEWALRLMNLLSTLVR